MTGARLASARLCAAATPFPRTRPALISGSPAARSRKFTTCSAMQLYTYPLAYNPQKATLVLEEKKLPYTAKKIDLFNGASLFPEYMRINPNATAPTLIDGERTLTDSVDIVNYVDSKGERLGAGVVDEALAQDWVKAVQPWDGNLFIAANGPAAAGKVLGGLNAYKIKYAKARAAENPDLQNAYEAKIAAMEKMGPATADPKNAEANRAELNALLDRAEKQLGSTKFLAGDAYSVADVLFTPVVARVHQIGLDSKFIDARPRVKAYFEAMQARPSYAKACAPAASKIAPLTNIVPALIKAKIAGLTGRY